MSLSVSSITTKETCSKQYQYSYVENLRSLHYVSETQTQSLSGKVLHYALSHTIEESKKYYYDSFPIYNDKQYYELIKLEPIMKKLQSFVSTLIEPRFEFQIAYKGFVGYIDILSKNEDGTYDIYDLKYSNNNNNKLDTSFQLHIYKYYMEQLGYQIKHLYYLLADKSKININKNETEEHFLDRLKQTPNDIHVVEVPYNKDMVIRFFSVYIDDQSINTPTNEVICSMCKFRDYCKDNNSLQIVHKSFESHIHLLYKQDITIDRNELYDYNESNLDTSNPRHIVIDLRLYNDLNPELLLSNLKELNSRGFVIDLYCNAKLEIKCTAKDKVNKVLVFPDLDTKLLKYLTAICSSIQTDIVIPNSYTYSYCS